MHLENRRDIKEMRNEFRGTKGYVVAYTIKTVVELLISVAFEFWIVWKGYGNIYTCDAEAGCTYINYKPCIVEEVSGRSQIERFVMSANILLLETVADRRLLRL